VIIGVGIDVVDIGRFEQSLARTPALRDRLFTPAEAQLPLQLFACELATLLGHDVDQPRNLAKSVTVE
jgi:glucosamine--fructose-6-phosphate aminotransferase (isomerizing)